MVGIAALLAGPLVVALLLLQAEGQEGNRQSTVRHASFALCHSIGAQEALLVLRSAGIDLAAPLRPLAAGGAAEAIGRLFDRGAARAAGTDSSRTPALTRSHIAMSTRSDYIFDRNMDRPMAGEPPDGAAAPTMSLPDLVPRTDDHQTVLSFARMSSIAYHAPPQAANDDGAGLEAEGDRERFGWDAGGLRGDIFLNDEHTIAVISFKGTSTIINGGDTVARDKLMDNMMFSCCCARVDMSWTPVCGCYAGSAASDAPAGEGRVEATSRCDRECLRQAVRADKESYYMEARAVTQLVVARYPRAQIWFTGHSLGGAVAALMAVSVRNTAAITFASPGPYLYAKNLGLHDDETEAAPDAPLDAPPARRRRQEDHPIWNFGLSSDPIYMGQCTSLVTSCYLSGYAMETACRHGHDCIYPISSWQPDAATHRIDWMIEHVIARPEKHALPLCVPNRVCSDCQKWSYVPSPSGGSEL